jgi:hypothetical protein
VERSLARRYTDTAIHREAQNMSNPPEGGTPTDWVAMLAASLDYVSHHAGRRIGGPATMDPEGLYKALCKLAARAELTAREVALAHPEVTRKAVGLD